MDHIRQCKEGLKVHKPSKSSSIAPLIFTDDGFPMGKTKTKPTHLFHSLKLANNFFLQEKHIYSSSWTR